jgi:hypothetical protein
MAILPALVAAPSLSGVSATSNAATLAALQQRRLVLISNAEPYAIRMEADDVVLVKNAGGLV